MSNKEFVIRLGKIREGMSGRTNNKDEITDIFIGK